MAWIRSNKKSSGGSGEDYIYNVHTASFNTGHNHTANTKVIFKACLYDQAAPSAYGQAFGARNGNKNSNAFGFFHRFNNARRYCFYRTTSEALGDVVGTASSTSSPFTTTVCIFTATGNTLSWYPENNPSDVHSITAAGTVDGGIAPLALFCCNNATTANGWNIGDFGAMRLYWFEIYESDVLEHRFVPAYNNDQYCLYDEETQTYFYDQTSSGMYLMGQVS